MIKKNYEIFYLFSAKCISLYSYWLILSSEINNYGLRMYGSSNNSNSNNNKHYY